MTGIVKWFNNEKGYGFIKYKGEDIFVHYTAIIDQPLREKNLVKGEVVEFKLVNTTNGYKAKNVKSS